MKAALIGEGISCSLTPAMHEAEGCAQGLSYQYDLFDSAQAPYLGMPLSDIIEKALADGYTGLNITHPFKLEAAAIADTLSGSAGELCSVNTITFGDAGTIGHNTDYVGFRSALRQYLHGASLEHVLLIGAGGAGRAVALGLIDQGVQQLTIHDRNKEHAAKLAHLLCAVRPEANIKTAPEIAVIDFQTLRGVVNATPVGMMGHPGVAIDVADISPQTWVADIVYFPLETKLLAIAKQHGCRVMNGSGMAILQAVSAFELITGHKADATRMVASFNTLLEAKNSASEAQNV